MVVASPDVLTLLSHTRLHGYMHTAATVLIWYDYFLTLSDEIQYFWGRRLTWATSLFFINRYVVLLTQTFNLYPKVASHVTFQVSKIAIGFILTGSGVLQQFIVDMILCVRLYAIYNKSKRVLFFLLTLLFACTISSIAVIAVVALRTRGTTTPAPGLSQCTIETPYKVLWLFWIPILVYESTGFSMVLYKAYQYLKERRLLRGTSFHTDSLIAVLYRDSLLYFAGIFALYVTTCVIFSNPDPSISGIMDGPTLVLDAIMGSRVLFNLRSEDRKRENVKSTAVGNITTVEFASNDTRVRTTDDMEMSADISSRTSNS
ncbi:unnamed protein product [Somion occarium]|uniref:DUF6533 domain-containing protein n=1 Tax=Somion occarium TaxID=3059160 RepID=A0ABP1E741_9APHY